MNSIHNTSITTLTLNQLVRDVQGDAVPITLHRLFAPLDLVPPLRSSNSQADFMLPDPLLRIKVEHLIPEALDLTMTIGKGAGDGSTGQVYHVDVDNSPTNIGIPPLVAKVCRLNRLGHIAREAWFYDELAVLQGVCIPRCYGWFEAELPDGFTVPAELQLEDETEEGNNDHDPYRVMDWGSGIIARSRLRRRISVLLLEELGEELPKGVPATPELKDDLTAIIDELCHLSIDHRDIRYPNFRRAPEGSSTLPSLPSPRTGRTYDWRVFDLELCEKYLVGLDRVQRSSMSHLRHLIQDLPDFY